MQFPWLYLKSLTIDLTRAPFLLGLELVSQGLVSVALITLVCSCHEPNLIFKIKNLI